MQHPGPAGDLNHPNHPSVPGLHGHRVLHRRPRSASPRADLHCAQDVDSHGFVVDDHNAFCSVRSLHSHCHAASGLFPLQCVMFKGELANQSASRQKEGHYLFCLSGGGLDYYILHLRQNHAHCQRTESRCKKSQKHVGSPWGADAALHGLIHGSPVAICFAQVVPKATDRPSICFLYFLSDNSTILDADPTRLKRQCISEALKMFHLPQSN